MNLGEALDQIETRAPDEVVFAKEPWTLQSEALVGRLDERWWVPAEIASQGFVYFLEVSVATEVLALIGGRPVSAEERRELLLYYAENDAYPDWVFDR